jgi:hypothetical protein
MSSTVDISCRSRQYSAPLQIYSSVLIFALKDSGIRNKFENGIPDWISQLPKVESDWNAVLQTLKGQIGAVLSVAFSHDSKFPWQAYLVITPTPS